jgi:phosphoglucosamine mutase
MAEPDQITAPNPDMTPELALSIGIAAGASYKNVIVGMDTGQGNRMIANAVISGLLSAGTDVSDAGVVPLPALAVAVNDYDCAIYIERSEEFENAMRIVMLGKDGSILSEEQRRQISKESATRHSAPDYKGIGKIGVADTVVKDYNRTVSDIYEGKVDVPVIVDCGYGSASLSLPHILLRAGAEAITLNALSDATAYLNTPDAGKEGVYGLIEAMRSDLGSIGIALNGDGTRLAVVDEGKNYVDPENVLALMLLYLRPSRVVVPVDASIVVDDAFHGLVGEGIGTGARFQGGERKIFRSEDTLEAVVAAIKENDADFGALKDGSFIFPSISLCPDAINAAVLLTKMSSENSIRNLLSSFPKYIVLKESVYCSGNHDIFGRKLTERLNDLEGADVYRINGWRVGMESGWFTVSRNGDDPDHIEITAEARDKAYVVSMMELAKEIVRDCT